MGERPPRRRPATIRGRGRGWSCRRRSRRQNAQPPYRKMDRPQRPVVGGVNLADNHAASVSIGPGPGYCGRVVMSPPKMPTFEEFRARAALTGLPLTGRTSSICTRAMSACCSDGAHSHPLGLGSRTAARVPRRRVAQPCRPDDAQHRRSRQPDGARRAHLDGAHRSLPRAHRAVDHKIASYVTLTADRARAAAQQADRRSAGGSPRPPARHSDRR